MTQSLKDTIQEINSRYAAALSQPGRRVYAQTA